MHTYMVEIRYRSLVIPLTFTFDADVLAMSSDEASAKALEELQKRNSSKIHVLTTTTTELV